MDRQQSVGLVGAALLLLGVFLPIVSLPIVGSQNYFRNGRGEGTILLVIAGIALLATLTRRYVWVSLAGLASLGLVLFSFFMLRARIAEMRDSMDRELADDPFGGLGNAMVQSVQMQWGWAVLVLGALLLCAAGIRSSPGTGAGRMRKCPECAEMILGEARKCRFCGSAVVPNEPFDVSDQDRKRTHAQNASFMGEE